MRGAVALCFVRLLLPVMSDAGDPPVRDAVPLLELAAGRGLDTLRVGPGQKRACLDHRPVLLGTLEVRRGDSTLTEGIHYHLDTDEGCLEFFTASADTTQFLVRYRYLPITAQLRVRLHVPTALESEAPPPLPEAAPPEAGDDGRLVVGGSKTFVVEVGSNRDAVLRQGLDLAVRGKLSRDVELEAVLSDRDSPATPEGTSSELEELDKVFIRVTSPEAEATFGDLEVTQPSGEFARYERRLEGVHVIRDRGGARLGGLAANARGVYRTIEFYGLEGQQGPYRLGEITGIQTLGIVPGSEDVFLDGERLGRGQDRDYTIDYALGEITFTPRRPITFDSRITIDFELQSEEYRRRFTGGEAGYRDPDGRWGARALFFSEQDDRASPRGFSLNEQEREILRLVGDDDPIGETFAATRVGLGNGDYVKVGADTSDAAYFDWVGMGNGDWLVSFVRVGEGLGAYADSVLSDGAIAYIFVGSGSGAFLPGRRLSRPESHLVTDLQLDLDTERVTLQSELAASAKDENTFSPRDDTDNDGFAGSGRLTLLGASWADGKGGLELSGRWRQIAADFSPLSRTTDSFDFLSWNYDPSGLTEGEERGLAGVTIRPGDGSRLLLETGRLRSGGAFRADRGSASYERQGRLTTRLGLERTWSQRPREAVRGYREVRNGRVSYAMGWFRPALRHRAELTRSTGDTLVSGNRFRSWGGEVGLGPAGPLGLTVEYENRADDTRDEQSRGEWVRASRTRDRGARLELARWRGVSGGLGYRRRTFASKNAGASRKTDLARLNVEALPASGAIRVLVDYQVTTEAILPRSKEIVYVGEGQGYYDSFGVFVGVGDYDVRIVQLDETELLSRMDLALRINLVGFPEETAPAFWREVRASTFARVSQASRLPFSRLLNPFDPALYGSGRETVEGNLTLRQEATIFPSAIVSPSLRWERFRRVDGRFENVRERSEEDAVALRLRSSPRPEWTASLEGTLEKTNEIDEILAPSFARQEETSSTRKVAAELTYQPTPWWTFALEGVTGRTRRPDVDQPEARYEIAPRVAWTPARAGRLEGRARWVDVQEPLARRRPVFGFGLANASGLEWSIIADYRLKQYMTIAGTLQAFRPRGAETLYDGRMELRAFF